MIALLALVAGTMLQCRLFQGESAISADKTTTVLIQRNFKVLIYKSGSDRPAFSGHVHTGFHHGKLIVNEKADRIVFLDEYAGIQVFDGTAKHLATVGPENCMTEKELKNRHGKWSCHLEGKWILKPMLRFTPEGVSLNIYTGRRIDIPLKG